MSAELITRFHTAFDALDAESMAACYAAGAMYGFISTGCRG